MEITAPTPTAEVAEKPALSAGTATPRERAIGIGLALSSPIANQTGAAVGALAFPAIGAVGVVAIRQMLTAAVLLPVVRPRFRGLTRRQWLPILGLALVMSIMNVSLYAAIDRIGLGLAVTLEFLGPLAVAIGTSRKKFDVFCAVLAGIGVVVLTNPGPSADLLGIGLALLAAGCWSSYILLNRTLGQRVPGLQGTALASSVSAALWLPVAIVWFVTHPLTLTALLCALVAGLLSSLVPYVADLYALRRVHASLFGTLASVNPFWAVMAGLVILGQALTLNEWVGIALIVTANVLVSARGLRSPNR